MKWTESRLWLKQGSTFVSKKKTHLQEETQWDK